MKAVVYTLGCKTNQYESGAVAKLLIENGYEVVDLFEKADLYVINTCAVTAEAERKSRQMARRVNTVSPYSDVIILGCAAQNSAKRFLEIPNVAAIGGLGGKVDIVQRYLNGERKFSDIYIDTQYEDRPTRQNRTRNYIKVQDGCDKFCSYCIVPLLRGRSRSRDIDSITKEILDCGAKEIVLGGIDLSDYRYNGLNFIDLVRRTGKLGPRIRISSLGVKAVSQELIDAMKEGNFCPHFHLSIQSGSNQVLKNMNRHYTKQDIIDACNLIRQRYPRAAITSDIIAGFPQETDQDHQETLDTLEKAGLSFMHIFPYSIRPNTRAAKMPQIDKATKRARVRDLENLREKLFARFLQSEQGKTAEVITEQAEDGYISGHTQNYIKAYLPKDAPMGELIKIKIGERFRDGVLGILV
ncbi:MAG TPA: tRNA (N(6)-L-threonylcarbamoyladenosine(37)-C(2))-methylthiotransferase MtaB [Clostridiales bacterium]|jgi:threonylcarbamoyladenosine tRNA methylthiotransferase MtaB|nr:tRNA (N(6)-L-threonylcarbamoyladenosine(37)-C(2))-methylthiotransferase MtaB [Clostridiales bacterium]